MLFGYGNDRIAYMAREGAIQAGYFVKAFFCSFTEGEEDVIDHQIAQHGHMCC